MAYYSTVGTRTTGDITVVDCQKQVRSWRLLRCVVETLIPCCNGTGFITDERDDENDNDQNLKHFFQYPQRISTTSRTGSNTVTGTIFGSRKGKVNLCIQTTTSKHNKNPTSSSSSSFSANNSTTTILLLELAVSTQTLAREMRGGFLRIALESTDNRSTDYSSSCSDEEYVDNHLLSTPIWKMYCNGRRVGYAVKRRPKETDSQALRLMGSPGDSGAGVIRGKDLMKRREDCDDDDDDGEIMYLRAKFERVCGSANSESFHLIDPDRCIGQELSVFFYRSR